MTQISTLDPPILPDDPAPPPSPRTLSRVWIPVALLIGFALGIGGGFLLWARPAAQSAAEESAPRSRVATLVESINPPEGYELPVRFNDLGPGLLEAGAIDLPRFIQVYQNAGRPLTPEQLTILQEGSAQNVVLNRENAYFLLNFFWAVGLANQNPILTTGPMMAYGPEQVGRFASTGGWTLGQKPAIEIYASAPLLALTPEQQARLERVAQLVYRPCCNNPTHFPDCNHGMAMLGLLTLMASEDASEAEMFAAAKYANAFWYPQQYFELALYFDTVEGQDFASVDAARVVSRDFSSGSGFGQVHQYLADNGLLQQAPGSGNSCGV